MATNVKRKKKAEVMSDDGSMTLTGHLKELRNRLIICAAVFVVGVIGFLAISDKLIDLLTAMAMNANYTFVFLAPQEKLMQYFRVSLIAAVIVTIPVALYQVYAFAKPGLKRSESFFFRLVLLFGLALFCVGVLFAYKVTLPFMLNFLVTLEGTDYITASISIESYINLCLTMLIIFGCVFEMPLVTIILAKMGIANPEIMKKGRGVVSAAVFCKWICYNDNDEKNRRPDRRKEGVNEYERVRIRHRPGWHHGQGGPVHHGGRFAGKVGGAHRHLQCRGTHPREPGQGREGQDARKKASLPSRWRASVPGPCAGQPHRAHCLRCPRRLG